MKYCEVFPNIREDTRKAVRELIDAKFYRKTQSEKEALLQKLLIKLSQIYEIQPPVMEFGYWFAGYDSCTKIIRMDKTSIVTFLHEFRHHLQHTTNTYNPESCEHDARAWSLSLFKQVTPKLYERSARAGKILFVNDNIEWEAEQ